MCNKKKLKIKCVKNGRKFNDIYLMINKTNFIYHQIHVKCI